LAKKQKGRGGPRRPRRRFGGSGGMGGETKKVKKCKQSYTNATERNREKKLFLNMDGKNQKITGNWEGFTMKKDSEPMSRRVVHEKG